MSALPLASNELPIRIQRLGLCAYSEAWELQRKALQALISGDAPETIFICEHPPTITLGKSAKDENVFASPTTLAELGVERFSVERGGDVTYHGPGQLVAYPILNLSSRRRDVAWYMRQLEESVIQTLHSVNLEGIRIPGKTGVWLGPSDQIPQPRKIASLGVRISRWCTMHGVALNVGSVANALPLETGFSLINPCGLGTIEVTSIAREIGQPANMGALIPVLEQSLLSIFGPRQPS